MLLITNPFSQVISRSPHHAWGADCGGHGADGWGARFQINARGRAGKPVYFLGINNVRFRKPVVPGDQLRLELEITKHRQSIWGFKGKASVDGKLVAEAELLAMLGDEK